MRRRVRTATLAAAVTAAAVLLRAEPQTGQVFRGAVDLIAVDVQVVDRRGLPVTGLGPDQFEVTIDGRRRRVVSADLIETRSASVPAPAARGGRPPDPPRPARAGAIAPPARVIIVAVDCGSFDGPSARGVAAAARAFIERLPPNDLVGLFAFPLGPKIDPTTDREVLIRALNTVTGQRDGAVEGEFHLRPSELIDLALWADREIGTGADIALKICGTPLTDPDVMQCRGRLAATAKGQTLAGEGEAHASLSMLGSLMRQLAAVPGRKTVVLASAGRIASDTVGARPNLDDLALRLGKAAAEGNTALYTLFIDQSWIEQYRAETRRPNVTQTYAARDSAVLGRWLDVFSGTAGGALMRVLAGNGDQAFDRVLTELSGYYLLGVEPAESDRDGRTHQIQVKVTQRDATVRGRAWVVVPTRAAATAAATAAAAAPIDTPVPPVVLAVAAGAVTPHPLPEPGASIAAAYERGDYAAVNAALARSASLANLIRDFRASDAPWPAAPRRTAVFALELAFGGLASGNGFARDEAIKLLAEYSAAVRRSPEADAFECSWYLTAMAGLGGLWQPDIAQIIASGAVLRCPQEPRLFLARAVATEQRWKLGAARASSDQRAGQFADTPAARDALRLYETAITFPATSDEARVRAAWLAHRIGAADRALAWIDAVAAPSADPPVRYFAGLVRGLILRARGRTR
jgi:VWFA-related protein